MKTEIACCVGNAHEIALTDSNEPSGSHCECGDLKIAMSVQDPHGRLLAINVIVEDPRE